MVWRPLLPTPLPPDVYSPSDDSFLFEDIVAEALASARVPACPLSLELGPGSGYVSAVAVKQLQRVGGTHVALDISSLACATCASTARLNGLQWEVVEGDLLKPIARGTKFDFIFFNPPYVPTDDEEFASGQRPSVAAAWAGGQRGRRLIDRFCLEAPPFLSLGGTLFLVVEQRNVPSEVRGVLEGVGLRCRTHGPRRAGNERLFVIEAVRDPLL
eukprot:Polyplicarium_translucidae@DN32_c0_g1_i1.p1